MSRPRSSSSSYSTISAVSTLSSPSPETQSPPVRTPKYIFSPSLTSPTRVHYDNGTGQLSPTLFAEIQRGREYSRITNTITSHVSRKPTGRKDFPSYMIPSRSAPFPPQPITPKTPITPTITHRPLPPSIPKPVSIPIATRTRVSAKQGTHFSRAKPYVLPRSSTFASAIAVPDYFWSGMHRKYGGMVPIVSVPIQTKLNVSERQGKFLGRGTLRDVSNSVGVERKEEEKKKEKSSKEKWWNKIGKGKKKTIDGEDVSGWY